MRDDPTLVAAPFGSESPEPHDPRVSGSSRAGRRATAMLVFGLIGVVGLIYAVGAGAVAHLILSLGWKAPLIVVPFFVITIFDVLGWQRALVGPNRPKVGFWSLFWIRVAGEAVNNITPTAGFGGEPVKAYLLRQRGFDTGAGVSSVVIAKSALIITQILFTLAGLMLFLDWLGVLADRAVWIGAGWIVGAAIAAALIVLQRRGMVQRGARLMRPLGRHFAFVARLERSAAEIDRALDRFYRDDPRGFLLATSYHMAGWIVGVWEVDLFLSLMGIEVTWQEAFIIESLTQAMMISGAFIPGGVGVQEASGAVLCRVLGIGDAPGVALMLLKRLREICFTIVGVLLLSWYARGGNRTPTSPPEELLPEPPVAPTIAAGDR